MSKLIASGNLVNIQQRDQVYVQHMYTGRFGIQLGGTFDGGTVVMASMLKGGSSIRTRRIDINDPASAFYVQFTVAGLYFHEVFLEQIELRLISGTDQSTDIAYNLFVGVRP